MAESMRSMLPPSYHHLFGAFFDRPKVGETRATCERCSMCDHGEPSPVPMEYFNPSTKCCTFWPILPNYLVGAILADGTPEMAEGRRRIRRAIEKRIGVAPQFMSRPRKMSLLMLGYQEVFGRAQSLKCPYYDDDNPAGTCSIWRHREVICMTYYCRYSGGMRGYDYWVALKNYLGLVQRALAKSAAKAVDPNVIEPQFKKNMLTLEDMEDLPPKETDYKAWWGRWVGREEEFYLKCHEWLQGVSPEEFVKNVDQSEDGKKALDELIAKYEILESKIVPQSLVRNARMREQHVGEKVVVTSYHRFDPIAIDKDLFEVVGMFKADQTLQQNLDRLRDEEGIELTPDLVEFLFVSGVLVEPTKAKIAGAQENAAESEGERTGRRAALKAIINARGLAIDAAELALIDGGSATQLDLWIKKAAIAKAASEIFS